MVYGESKMSRFKIILFLCCSYLSKVSSYEKDKYLPSWTSYNESWNIYSTTRAPQPHTGKHWEWKSYTTPPYKHENVFKKNDLKYYWIFFSVMVILLSTFGAYGMYFYYKKARHSQRNNVNGIYPSYISHIRATPQASALPTTSHNITTETPDLIVSISILQTNSLNKNVEDHPPEYDDVVQDNMHGKNKFPSVTRCLVEAPPPTYDNVYKMRY